MQAAVKNNHFAGKRKAAHVLKIKYLVNLRIYELWVCVLLLYNVVLLTSQA